MRTIRSLGLTLCWADIRLARGVFDDVRSMCKAFTGGWSVEFYFHQE